MKSIKPILIGIAILFTAYWIFFVLTPNSELAEQTYKKIDSLNNNIKVLEEAQKKLDSNITNFNNQITELDKGIDRIKNQKETIKEIYHETINNVDNYNGNQLDSFFTNRYYSGQ